MMDVIAQAREAAKARFDKIVEAQDKIRLAQEHLAELGKLGELVGPDDVVEAAAKMAAGGIDPHLLAGYLADMPQVGGEPLQGWLAQHVAALGQADAQLGPMREAARHELAVAALGQLSGHHMGLPQEMPGVQGAPTGPEHPAGEYVEPPPALPGNQLNSPPAPSSAPNPLALPPHPTMQ